MVVRTINFVHATEPDDILVARLVDKERTYVSVVMFRKYHHNIDVISVYELNFYSKQNREKSCQNIKVINQLI